MDLGAPRPRYRLYSAPGSYLRVAREVLLGRSARGPGIEELEARLMAFSSVPRAVCMPSARVGIFLVLKNLIRPGQEVVLSPYTIADVVNMVICAGGVPVFADVERSTCNIDPKSVARLIGPRTGAVLATHLHGLCCDLEPLSRLCREKGIPLVEDAAQAFGASLDGRRAGTWGQAGVYSFGMYKNVNAIFGGAVVTSDS